MPELNPKEFAQRKEKRLKTDKGPDSDILPQSVSLYFELKLLWKFFYKEGNNRKRNRHHTTAIPFPRNRFRF